MEESTLLEESDKEKRNQTIELRLEGLEQLESELQTEEDLNKKFNAEFNSVNEKNLAQGKDHQEVQKRD